MFGNAAEWLGYFDPDAFLGGRMTLQPEAAERALAQAKALNNATVVEPEMYLTQIPFYPANRATYDFEEVEATGEKFDGLIVTGAPIEHLPFQEVTYWDELTEVMDWTHSNVHSTLGVCWGGMAMAWHFHGLEKHMLPHKAFGCFRHQNMSPASPYLRGFSDDFVIPVSRWTEMRQDEIDDVKAAAAYARLRETARPPET